MDLISELFMGAAALGAAVYCFVLSRRLRRFTDLEQGVGGAVAVLATQVNDLNKALADARRVAGAGAQSVERQVARAEAASERLELLIASLSDLETSQPTALQDA